MIEPGIRSVVKAKYDRGECVMANKNDVQARVCVLLAGMILVFAQAGFGQTPESAENQPAPKDATTVPSVVFIPETGHVKVGEVEIDPVAHRIQFPAEINMQEGLLEYAIVADRGKLHESLLSTDVDPLHVQVALTLLGLKGRPDKSLEPNPAEPVGEKLRIEVEWTGPDGTLFRKRLEQMITDQSSGKAMRDMQWVFTGSRIVDGVLMVLQERSLVAIYRDSLAMIENPLPEAIDDTIWFVRTSEVPSVGTPVKVTMVAQAQETSIATY
jgi:hypothetical protein